MKKFLKTLFDEFPELKKDKDSIEKMVYLLQKNKPSINIDKKFKNNLRNRVLDYSKLKSRKKTNFLVFLAPIFSLVIVAFWFVYFSNDIFILDNQEKNWISIMQGSFNDPIMMESRIVSHEESINKQKATSDNDWLEATSNIQRTEIIIEWKQENVVRDNNIDIGVRGELDDDLDNSNKAQSISSFSTFEVNNKSDFENYCDSIDWEYVSDENDKIYCLYKDKKCYKENFVDWICDNF